MVQKQSSNSFESEDISSTGVIAEVATPGDALVSLNIEATADASYALDVSPDGDTWFEGEREYKQSEVADPQDIRDGFQAGDAHLRVRVTSTATAGETATVTIQQAH